MTLCTFKHVNIQIAWKIYLSFGKKEKKQAHFQIDNYKMFEYK